MSERSWARHLMRVSRKYYGEEGHTYQQALQAVRALGDEPFHLHEETGWELKVCALYLCDSYLGASELPGPQCKRCGSEYGGRGPLCRSCFALKPPPAKPCEFCGEAYVGQLRVCDRCYEAGLLNECGFCGDEFVGPGGLCDYHDRVMSAD